MSYKKLEGVEVEESDHERFLEGITRGWVKREQVLQRIRYWLEFVDDVEDYDLEQKAKKCIAELYEKYKQKFE